MKKIILITLFFATSALSNAQSSITFSFGLATPDNKINDVYNTSTLLDENKTVWDLFRDRTKLGYDLAVRLRFPLSKNFQFDGGIGFARFPQSAINVADTSTGQTVVSLITVQNVIPISAGLDVLLARSFVTPYLSAELQYNYISSTVDYPTGTGSLPLNLDTAPVDSRIGAAIGGGMMIDLKITAINIDMRYHIVNLIGRTSSEQTKSYVTLNAGVTFGWIPPKD